MNKVFRYIEKRNENNLLIGYEEVKTASTPDEIVVLNRTIKANNEKITAENKIKDDELKEVILIKKKEKELKEFCDKYSFRNFLLAIQLPIVLGDFNDFDFVEKLKLMNDKYEIAKLIKSKLEASECIEVKKYFEKL